MADFHWRLPALVSTLDDDSLLARPLLLPGVSSYARGARQLKEALRRRVADVLREFPPGEMHRVVPAEIPARGRRRAAGGSADSSQSARRVARRTFGRGQDRVGPSPGAA